MERYLVVVVVVVLVVVSFDTLNSFLLLQASKNDLFFSYIHTLKIVKIYHWFKELDYVIKLMARNFIATTSVFKPKDQLKNILFLLKDDESFAG